MSVRATARWWLVDGDHLFHFAYRSKGDKPMHHVHLTLNQRAVVIRDGKAERALGPGRYTFWKRREIVMFDTDELVFTAPVAVLAALPPEWYEVVHLAAAQYAIVFKDDRPVRFLHPGIHRVWKVDTNVTLRAFAETDPLPELTDELRKAIPKDELLEAPIEVNVRAVMLRDGKPERVLAPGHYAFWGKHRKLVAWNIDDLVLAAQPDVLAMLPAEWYRTVHLGPLQRAVVLRDDKPVKFLRPGIHRVWTINPSVEIRTYTVTDEAPELTDELRAIVPAGELVEQQIRQFERGLKYVQGKFEGILPPGHYAYWNHPAARIGVSV
ncbi:MAG TPA: hypothetical protein VGO00_14225, partial [Kofleriaceae bacterium]|nr:hypothetical protein [Kofleriaceae bacterium]